MIVSLEEIKKYLRLELDYTEEDDDLESFIKSAEEYLKGATGFKFVDPLKVPERAKMIIKLLVSHWYDNRAVYATGTNMGKIEFTVNALLAQLAYTHVEGEFIV